MPIKYLNLTYPEVHNIINYNVVIPIYSNYISSRYVYCYLKYSPEIEIPKDIKDINNVRGIIKVPIIDMLQQREIADKVWGLDEKNQNIERLIKSINKYKSDDDNNQKLLEVLNEEYDSNKLKANKIIWSIEE